MSTYIITPTLDQEKLIADFLEEQHISFVKDETPIDLPEHVLTGIKQGLDDFEQGNYISLDEFKKKLSIFK